MNTRRTGRCNQGCSRSWMLHLLGDFGHGSAHEPENNIGQRDHSNDQQDGQRRMVSEQIFYLDDNLRTEDYGQHRQDAKAYQPPADNGRTIRARNSWR